jgi:serine/threonine-protein kinase RsbW
VRAEIPASLEEMDALEERVAQVLRSAGVSDDDAYEVRIAFHEALVNAIQHGCRGDRRCRIGVALDLVRDRLRLLVRDPGPGFDPERLPDPLAPENLTRAGGRGVFYMRRYADAVVFRFPRRGGTAVRLVKRLGRTEPAPAGCGRGSASLRGRVAARCGGRRS